MKNANQKRALRMWGAIARRGRDLCIRSLRTLRGFRRLYSRDLTMFCLIFILIDFSIILAILFALYASIVDHVYTDPDQTTSLNEEAT